jgi:hypothetical protein
MKLKVNREKHIKHIITIWSGYHSLTKLESTLLEKIILHYLLLKDNIKDESLINKNFLDSEFKKNLMEELSIKPPQLTVYLSSLIEKKVLSRDTAYHINKKFLPTNKIVFEFIYE